jgi:hypothetical protein
MYLGNNAALLGCQEYFNRCASAGSPIGATQTPSSYDNAASFNGTNQFLSIPSNSTLQSGAGDFTFSLWLRLSTASGVQIHLNKGGNATLGEYILWTNGGTLFFLVVDTAGNITSAQSSNTLVANTWYHVVGSYVASSRVSSVRVNDSASNSGASNPNAANQGSLSFEIGARLSAQYSSASIASVGFWKRALSASEVTQLWNNGAGRTYASLDTGLRNNLISWWALNGTSSAVSLTDSHTGGNNLTNTGSVTAPNIGPVVTALSDPRQLIIDFAQGIDRLGLWNSMVCWPLRSSQNAGSGTTAFSLGGLGQFDGTLVGSPSRGANGVNFAGTAQMTTSFGLTAGVFSNLSQMVAYDKASWSPNEFLAGTRSVIGNDFAPGIAIGSDSATTLRLKLATTAFNSGGLGTPFAQMAGRHIVSIYKESVSMMGLIDGGAIFSGPLNYGAYSVTSPTASNFAIGPSFGGMVSVALLYTGNNFPASNIHNLYRQTLGLGLGLP